MTKTRKPSQLRLDENILSLSRGGSTLWRMEVSSLQLVGEYTTDHGPFADDLFLIFIARNTKTWFEVSMHETEAPLAELSERLNYPLKHGLCNQTEFASRVIWPPALEGAPLFNRTPKARGTGWLARAKDWILPTVAFDLTLQVKAYQANPQCGAQSKPSGAGLDAKLPLGDGIHPDTGKLR